MKNKKYILSLCLCFTMLLMAGCSETKDLTEEQQDVIAEYAAGIVLQHDEGYSRRLVKQEVVATPVPTVLPETVATPTPIPTDEGEDVESAEEETASEVTLNDIYQIAGMDVAYSSHTVCQNYAKTIMSHKGNCLYVVSFKVKNTTKDSLNVNLRKHKVQYILSADGVEYDAPGSLTDNDMKFLKTTIKAGATEKAVVVFEVPKDTQKAEKLSLRIQDGEKVNTIQLKS